MPARQRQVARLLTVMLIPSLVAAIVSSAAEAQTLPQVRQGFTQREIELWMVKLDLSEGQTKFLQEQFDSYRTLRAAANRSVGEEYRDAREAAMELASTQYATGLAEAFDKAFRLSDRVSAAVAVFDQQFATTIQESLSEEQRALFPRLLISHERYVYRNEVTLLPETGVDLIEFFEPITAAEIALAKHTVGGAGRLMPPKTDEAAADELQASRIVLSDPTEAERIEPILRTYEVELVPALRAARAAERSAAEASYPLMDVRRIIARDQIFPLERPDLHKEEERLQKKVAEEVRRPALRLVAINRNYLAQLRTALSPENAARLDRLYKQTAWPDVYPDLASAMHLYEEVLAWDELDDDQRTAIEARQSEFRNRHEQLSAEMAASVSRRRSLWLRAEIPGHNGREWDELAALSADRFTLDEAQRARIAEFLTPEQLPRLPEWIYANRPEPKPWRPSQWDDEDRRRHGR